MTVLVGVRCRDGVVIGADSAGTFAAGATRTIEQPVKKVEVIDDHIIVASAGEGGLGQRFCHTVRQAWESKVFMKHPIDVGRHLCTEAVKDFAQTQATRSSYGALVAFPVKGELHLCEFAESNFQPELKTENLWYVSMGSGQTIADPCLGFIRQVFWNDGMPSCRDGLFAVVWTLQQAIKLNPGGINEPMQIAILAPEGGKPRARLIDADEVREHVGNVDGAIEYLRGYSRLARGDGATSIPTPPTIAGTGTVTKP